MSEVHPLIKAFMEPGETNPAKAKVPIAFVEKMLDTTSRLSYKNGREDEREELVCRLIASGMPVDEISVILRIRADEIRAVEHNNANIIIPDYVKKLKARRKSREKVIGRK